MAGKMLFGCNAEFVFVLIMLLLFLAFNIGLNYYDNWVLSPGPYPVGLGFPAPLVYALCHAFACLLCSVAMIYGRNGNKVTYQMFWKHKFKIVLNSLLLTASIVIAWFMCSTRAWPSSTCFGDAWLFRCSFSPLCSRGNGTAFPKFS